MSHISVKGDQSTEQEVTTLANLTALAISDTGEFIRKTGITTFENSSTADAGGVGNRVVEDLSSQLNGARKIFPLANAYQANSVSLMGTQFPIIYRPVVDFKESSSAEISLTGEVGAPASGQTLVVTYEKAT